MSKKKRRHRNKRVSISNHLDRHHICYQRRYWKGEALHELRDFWYSIILIPRDTLHHEIHQEVEAVPPPKNINARHALVQLRLLEKYGAIKETDSLEFRLKVYIALFEYTDKKTADGFRKQLEIVRRFNQKSP